MVCLTNYDETLFISLSNLFEYYLNNFLKYSLSSNFFEFLQFSDVKKYYKLKRIVMHTKIVKKKYIKNNCKI